ncbi:DUF305 domain-containing protein [Pseudonocardia saturnea]
MAAGLVLVAVLGTGCGAPDAGGPAVVVPGAPGEPAQVLPGAEAAERRAPLPVSPADVAFVTQMIPHHRQALEMAALAPGRAADPRVLAVAERIDAVQGPEIAVLEAWLRDHGDGTHASHGPAHAMPGTATPAQLAALAAASGPAFDRLFVELMTAHHQGAVTMAQEVDLAGTDAVVDGIARDVASTQRVEIERMRDLLG